MRPPTPFHVMVIDDSPMDRLLAEEALMERDPGLAITSCEGGTEALSCLDHLYINQQTLPDVIMLDLNMPGMNGLEVLARLKARQEYVGLPVVILTTSTAPHDVEKAYALHASSYLVKAQSYPHFLTQMSAFLSYWTQVIIPHHVR